MWTPANGNLPFFAAAQKNVKTTVKAAPGQLFGWSIANLDASITYLQLFDALVANVTVGTTAPNFDIVIPASGALNQVSDFPAGNFQNGITIAATTTATGSTAQTNGLVLTLFYA